MTITNPAGSVVVIVLNHNKKDDLLECLRSVRKSSGENREVVVVDNGSTDGSATAVSETFPEVHLVQSPRNLGAPGGRNLGIDYISRNIRCRYVLFLDNDAMIHERCMGELTAALDQDSTAAIACPKTFREPGSDILFSAGIRVKFATVSIFDRGSGKTDRGQYDRLEYVDACGAFAFLIRRDILDQVGGFEETFNPYGWEDVDLCLRAGEHGFKTLYVPNAVAYHKGGKTGRGVVPRYEKFKARNFIFLMKRHARTSEWASAAIFAPLRVAGILSGQMVRGKASSLIPFLRGLWEGFNGK